MSSLFLNRDRQQITFVMLNRFCPLSKLPRPHFPVLNEQKQAGWNPKQQAKLNEKYMSFGTFYFEL